MWRTNLKIGLVAAAVLAFYTTVAHLIPQLQSAVPETVSVGAGASPEELVAAGERIYHGSGGCTACHELGTRAPNLLTDYAGQGAIGARCGSRKPGMDCKAYLYESLVNPGAYVVPGFAPIMPNFSAQLTPEQLWSLVAFLEAQGGQVTVTAQDLAGSQPAPANSGAAPAGAGAASTTTDPLALLREQGCLGCHRLGNEGNAVGPPFDHLGARATKDYIRQSILDPNAQVTKGYERFKGMMPTFFGQRLSAAQLEILVDFLASRK